MPRVSDQHRAARRAQIVVAAGRLFAENGFHVTSMADIIGESGLSAGAVYRYFRSKEEIIGAVAEAVLSTADETFAELLADGATPAPAQAVHAILDHILARVAGDPVTGQDMTRTALQAWAEALRNPELGRLATGAFGRLRDHYAEVARRWQAAGNLPEAAAPEQVGAVLLGLTQGFVLQRLLIPGTTVAGYTAGIDALLGSPVAAAPRRSSGQDGIPHPGPVAAG